MRTWLAIALALAGSISFLLADESAKKEAPKASALKGDVKRGEKLFEDRCSECHDAFSKDERVGPGLQGISKGKIPDGRKATFELLLDIINTGPAEMTSFKDLLTEQEKADIVSYVLTL